MALFLSQSNLEVKLILHDPLILIIPYNGSLGWLNIAPHYMISENLRDQAPQNCQQEIRHKKISLQPLQMPLWMLPENCSIVISLGQMI